MEVLPRLLLDGPSANAVVGMACEICLTECSPTCHNEERCSDSSSHLPCVTLTAFSLSLCQLNCALASSLRNHSPCLRHSASGRRQLLGVGATRQRAPLSQTQRRHFLPGFHFFFFFWQPSSTSPSLAHAPSVSPPRPPLASSLQFLPGCLSTWSQISCNNAANLPCGQRLAVGKWAGS